MPNKLSFRKIIWHCCISMCTGNLTGIIKNPIRQGTQLGLKGMQKELEC